MIKNNLDIYIEKLENSEGIPLPAYMTEDSSGLDLYACIPGQVKVLPGKRVIIPTGIKLMIPPGFEGQVRPRSGLAIMSGITVLNTPGTVDADYRGEVKVIIFNAGDEPFSINRGDRIAQLVITPVVRANLIKVESVDSTLRNEGGFGSTG